MAVCEKMGGYLQRYDREKTIFRIPIYDNHSGVLSHRDMTKVMTKDKTVVQNTAPGSAAAYTRVSPETIHKI